jgi:hypothetical protein
MLQMFLTEFKEKLEDECGRKKRVLQFYRGDRMVMFVRKEPGGRELMVKGRVIEL